MDRITFGYPITDDFLRDLSAVVAHEFGSEMRDVFYIGSDKKALSTTDRFKYNLDVIKGRANPEESVSFRFQPDRKIGTHCMVLFPVDDGFIGIVFTHNDEPLQLRLYHFCTRLLVRLHLDRVKTLLDSLLHFGELRAKYEERTRELEKAHQVKGRLEVRVRELSEELEEVTRVRGVEDYANLLRVARCYAEELRWIKHEFALAIQNNTDIVREIQELNSFCIPKLAEYETTIHSLRSRNQHLEAENVINERKLAAASDLTTQLDKTQAQIAAFQKERIRSWSDTSEQTKYAEKYRGDQALTDLLRRVTQAEEKALRLRQTVERLTEGTLALKAKLAEEGLRSMKFDMLLKVVSDISNISTNYRDLGFDAGQALAVIHKKLAKLM